MKLTKTKIIITLVLPLLLLCNSNYELQGAENENQCYKCHTSARNLIKITREIAKTSPPEPKTSSESKGEG
jgi:hypothetical protein